MKVAIYCRLSEEDRNKQYSTDESESIQNQKSLLLQYAMDMKWEVYNIYSDDDYTGSDRNRPQFNKLISDAEKRSFDIVLCKTQSRFTRELEIVEKYIHGLFPLWNIRFISIIDNIDTSIKGNKKSRQINGLINEWYLEDMSENIKSVLTNKRKNGFHIGSFALYGYIKDPNNKGKLLIDEEAAEVVREVFHLYLQDYGKSAIARILNERGIPNPTEYKRLKGVAYKQPKTHIGTLWHYYSVSNMLTNEMYIGNMVQGRYSSVSYKTKINKPVPKDKWLIVKNTHEPIIDIELWNNVQNKIKLKSKPFSSGKIGIFSKKVLCKYCGYTMKSCKNNGYYYLKCSKKHISKDSCAGSFISIRVLEQKVLEELNILVRQCLNRDELNKNIKYFSNLKEKKKKILTEILSYEKKINLYTIGITNLYLDKVKEIICEKQFIDLSDKFSKEKERCEKHIDKLTYQVDDIDFKLKSSESNQIFIEQCADVGQLDRIVVEKLIECIYVERKNPITKITPVEIYWNI